MKWLKLLDNYTFNKENDLLSSDIQGKNLTKRANKKKEFVIFIRKKTLIKLSETSNNHALVRFGMSNFDQFEKYFFTTSIFFYLDYFAFPESVKDCVDLNLCVKEPWSEQSVAYFCKEILKALKFLEQNHISYGCGWYDFCVNKSGEVKLNFNEVINSIYKGTVRDSGNDFPAIIPIAPEFLKSGRSEETSIAGDIYSLGAQALFLLEGDYPKLYRDLNPIKYLVQVVDRRKVPRLRKSLKFDEHTRRFTRSTLRNYARKRGTIESLSSHEFIQNALSKAEFQEYLVTIFNSRVL